MKRFALRDLFFNPEYRVELSVVLFLAFGLAISIFVHQLNLNGIEDLLRSINQSSQHYDLNKKQLEEFAVALDKIGTDLEVYVGSGSSLTEKAVRDSLSQIETYLSRVRSYLGRASTEEALFTEINQLHKQKIVWVEAVIRRYKSGRQETALELFRNPWGQYLTDNMIQISQELIAVQKNNLNRQLASHLKFVTNARRAELVSIIIVFVIVSISSLTLLSETAQRLKLQLRLSSAKEEAERSARIKEQFMANMSHEIRTPLNAIVGFTNLLKKTPLQARQQEYVDSIHYSGENLLAIVNDILDLSKMEAGMMQLEEIPFSIHALIYNIKTLFHHRAEEKGVALEVEISLDPAEQFVGDPTRLLQILVNLLNNAIKFTENGQVFLRVTEVPQEKPTNHERRVCIAVQDTGIGIPKDQLDKVFERFNQVNTASTRKYGGAGLGLTIVKGFVTLIGGSIQITSKEGQGTTVTLELPYRVAQEAEQAQVPARVEAAQVPKPDFKNARVLVVEDNPMNRRIIELVLEEWAVPADEAENGKQALELLQQHTYDLVLMDIQMPELDGYQTTTAIRRELGIKVPIIAMTAHVLPGEREKCLQYGMDEYLSKPLDFAALQRMLIRFLPGETPLQLDMDYLREASQGEKEHLQELARVFLEHLPKEMAALQAAFEARDFFKVQRIAHSMRSTVGYIGLSQSLSPMLRELEQNAGAQDVTSLIEQVQAQCAAAMLLVKKQLASS
ncbi:MAG: response regulator [Saprospiraceae bacterium]|nr:response regulator [Saprospiraceae bacterium]